MVTFVNQDKMSPVELALETARFDFACLSGLHACNPAHPEDTWPIRTEEVTARIDDALRYLGLMGTPADHQTASE